MYQLELDGTVVVDRRVAALDVVEAVDVVADRQRGTGAALEVIDSFELALEVEKKLSATALSQQSPFRLMLHSRPLASGAFR